MARLVAGGTPEALAIAVTAKTRAPDRDASVRYPLLVPGTIYDVYLTETGVQRLTDLAVDADGTAIDAVTADDYGAVPAFRLPEGLRVRGVWLDPRDESTKRFWLPIRVDPVDLDGRVPDPTSAPIGSALIKQPDGTVGYTAIPGTGTSQVSIGNLDGTAATARTWWRGVASKVRSLTIVRAAGDFLTWADGRASVGDGVNADARLPYLLQGEDFTPESGIVAGIGSLSKQVAMWVTDAAEVGFYKVIMPLKSIAKANLTDDVQDALPGSLSAESGVWWGPQSPSGAMPLQLLSNGLVYIYGAVFGSGGVTGLTGGSGASSTASPTGIATATGTSPNRTIIFAAAGGGKRTTITTTGGGTTAPIVTTNGRVRYFEGTDPVEKVTTPGSGIVATAESIDDIAGDGDSHTDGVGSGGSTGNRPDAWLTKLGQMLAVNTFNYGYAGQTGQQILARQGAMRATVGAFTIPADTSAVAVSPAIAGGTYGSDNNDPMWSDGLPRTELVTIAGVPGTLTCTQSGTKSYVGVYTFARTTAGSAVTVPAATPLYFASEIDSRSRTHILWQGRNNLRFGLGFPSIVDANAAFWADRDGGQQSYVKRKLIIGMTSKTTETPADLAGIVAYNASEALKYGRNFLDIDAYLRTPQALADAGITATSDDLADMAAGLIARSLHSGDGSGGTHFNAAAHLLIAQQIRLRFIELGWSS